MLSHVYTIAIDCVVGPPVNGKYVADGFNATDKRFLKMLMKTVKLSCAATNNSRMVMNISMSST